MTRHKLRFVASGLVMFFLAAPLSGFEPLPRADPSTTGIDPVALQNAVAAFADVEGAWAILVVRQGAVVAEHHVVAPPDSLHPVWSVTKSLTSTAMGMAMHEGVFADEDVRLVDHLPPGLVPSEPAKSLITLRHLLTMTSGLGWSEDLDWLTWLASADPARFILERELTSWPGAEFNYSSANSHLPSLMLATSSAEGLDDFMQRKFFQPLGISEWLWDADPQGYAFGGHGVHLRTEDLAKLGVLFLSEGLWSGQTVVPAAWVSRAVKPQFFWNETYGPLDDLDYGYLWWTGVAADNPVYLAWGWGGQFVFCVPDLELVVATAADGMVWSAQAEYQELAILDIIVNTLMPAVPNATIFSDSFESGDTTWWTVSVP